MKRLIIIFVSIFLHSNIFAQQPSAEFVGFIPEHPTEDDVIRIVTKTITPNTGYRIFYEFTQQEDTIYLHGCFYNGILLALKTYLDTTEIGTLPKGSYFVKYTAVLSFVNDECDYDYSKSIDTILQVGVAGIGEQNFNEKINLYPNPTKRLLHVEGALNEVEIYDAQGKKVLEFKVDGNQSVIDLKNLEKGFYLIYFDKDPKSYKLVVN
jgi:hypothetical protein